MSVVLLFGCFTVPASATGLSAGVMTASLGSQLASFGFSAAESLTVVKGLATSLLATGVPQILIGTAIVLIVAHATRNFLENVKANTTETAVTVTAEMAEVINAAVEQWYNPATTEFTLDGLAIANFAEQSVPYLAVEGTFVFETGVWKYRYSTVNRYSGTVYAANQLMGLGLYGVTQETVPTMNFTWTGASYNPATNKLTATLALQATAGGVVGFTNNLTWNPSIDADFPVGRVIGLDGQDLFDGMTAPLTGIGDDVISLTDGMVLGADKVDVTTNDLATTFDITTTATAEDIRNPEPPSSDDKPLWRKLFAPIIGFITGTILSNLLYHYLPDNFALAFTIAIYAVFAFWIIRLILNR